MSPDNGSSAGTSMVPDALFNDPAPPSSRRRYSPFASGEAVRAPEPPEPPRRRRGGGFLSKISAFFTFLVFLGFVGGAAIMYGQSLTTAAGPLEQDKVVFIPRGSGLVDITGILEQEGVINQPTLFQISHYLSGSSNLKAGEYQFKAHASLKDVRDTLTEGKSILHSITIPEGLTSEQIVNRLKENDILVGDVRSIPREGSLLPDTYRFGRGFSREQLIARMESEQRRALQEIWARRSAEIPIRSPNDLVILASIVEKETGRADERTRVASVFVNRLNRGMRLESDPTIIYGIVGGKGSLGRGILASEIRAPTPYNTYVINGLPPGPIANPGRAAMEATANPSKTRDIFFVADGTGGHAFAETLEQHNRNVARWRQIERDQSGGSAPAAPAPAAAPRPGQRSDLPPVAEPQLPRMAAGAPTQGAQSPFHIPEAPLGILGFSGNDGGTGVGGGVMTGVGDAGPLPPSSGPESFPVSVGRRQELQRNAAVAGANPGPIVPSDPSSIAAAEATPSVPAAAARRGSNRGFDAVEGTARDPLRNKTFDLNSAKTIPQLR